jgi:glycosyltransferase involved in cell wall biosynthesis
MENNLPLVSVAVITYNQKDFLQECIESILTQDYPNIEIVIADDASTDGTQAMLHEYNIEYPGKFVLKLSETNQGITKNSNLAHFACAGKYIAWMGGDDLMLPGKIKKQVDYMEQHPECTICYHNLDVFQSETNETLYLFNNSKNSFFGDVRVVLKHGTFNGACSNMLRRDKAPFNAFDERLPIASDWLYWAESLLNGGKIHYINEVLGRYRRHSKNITNTLINQQHNNQIDHLNSCNILLAKVPQFHKEILFRYSTIMRALRLNSQSKFLNFTLVSFKIGCNFKALIIIIVYVISLGKVKL